MPTSLPETLLFSITVPGGFDLPPIPTEWISVFGRRPQAASVHTVSWIVLPVTRATDAKLTVTPTGPGVANGEPPVMTLSVIVALDGGPPNGPSTATPVVRYWSTAT